MNEKKKSSSYVHELNERRKRELEEEEEKKRREEERKLAESAFNILDKASSSSPYQEAVNLSKAASTASLAGLKANAKEGDIVDLTDKYGKEAPVGDTDLIPRANRDNPFTRIANANAKFAESIRLQGEALKTEGLKIRKDFTDVVNTLALIGQDMPTSTIYDFEADAIADYGKGKRDVGTELAFTKLRYYTSMLSPEEQKLVPELMNLTTSLENGTYTGDGKEISDIFEKARTVLYLNWYEQAIAPASRDYAAQQALNKQNYEIGDFMNAAVDIGGTVTEFAGLGALGMPPGIAMGATMGLAQDSTQTANYLKNGGTLSIASNNAEINAAKSAAFAAILNYLAPMATAGQKTATSVGGKILNYARTFVNALAIGEGASLSTQALNLLKQDPTLDFIDWNAFEKGVQEGKYQTLQDYTNSKEFEESVVGSVYKQALITALYNAANSTGSQIINDIKQGRIAKAQAKEARAKLNQELEKDLANLGLNKGATPEEIEQAHRSLVKKLHPDRGGDKDAFVKMQTSYDKLKRAIENNLYDYSGVKVVTTSTQAAQEAQQTQQAPQEPLGLPSEGQTVQPTNNLPANINGQPQTPASQVPAPTFNPAVATANNGNPEQPSDGVGNQLPTSGNGGEQTPNNTIEIKASDDALAKIKDIVNRHATRGTSKIDALIEIESVLRKDNGLGEEFPFGYYPEANAIEVKAKELYEKAWDERFDIPEQPKANGTNAPEELKEFAKIPGAKYEVDNGIEKVTLEPNDDAWRTPIGGSYKDTTQDELNHSPVYFTVHGKNSGKTYTTVYKNVNDMKKDWRDTYGGLNQIIGTGANKSRYTILSAAGKGEYYYERDRHSLGGWKWVDGNDITVDGETRTRRMQQKDAEWEANKKTFKEIETKYGTIATENIDGKDISYIDINKSGPKSRYKEYFRYDNPLTTNDGVQDATINTYDLDWKPVVAVVTDNGHMKAYAFKSTYDMKKWLNATNYRTLAIARNTSGSSYSLAEENGEMVWRSDYDGRRVKPDIGRPLVEEALGKYKSAFTKPPTTVRHVDVRGETFSNASELANIMQKVIDPISETDRIVFSKLKGKNAEEILGIEETSQNKHAATARNNYKYVLEDKTKYADFLARKAAALGADYVYAVHNHPGHSAPSGDTGDLGASAQFRAVVKSATERNNHKLKYGGGLVEGYDGYSFYGGGNRKNFKSTVEVKKGYDKYGYLKDVDEYIQVPYSNGYKYDNFVNEAWAKKRPTAPADFVDVANEIPYEVGCSKIVITDYDDRPMFVGNVLDRFLTETPSKINDLLYEISRNYGGGIVGAVTKNKDVYSSLTKDGVKVNISVLDIPGEEKSAGNIYQGGRYLGDYAPRQFPFVTLKGVKYANDVKWYTPKNEVVDDEDFIGRRLKPKQAEEKTEKWDGKSLKKSKNQKTRTTNLQNPALNRTEYNIRQIEAGKVQRNKELGSDMKVSDIDALIREDTNNRVIIRHNKKLGKALGLFDEKSLSIFKEEISDFPTSIHEWVHSLNKSIWGNIFEKYPNVKQTLLDICKTSFPGKKEGGEYSGIAALKEGLAEAGRYYAEDPGYLKDKYLPAYEMLENELEASPKIKEIFQKMQTKIAQYVNMTPEQRLDAHIEYDDFGKQVEYYVDNAATRFGRKAVQILFNDLEPLIKIQNLKAKRLGKSIKSIESSPNDDLFHMWQDMGAEARTTQIMKGGYVNPRNGKQVTVGFGDIGEELTPTRAEAKEAGMSVSKLRRKNVHDLMQAGVSLTALEDAARNKKTGLRWNDIKAVAERQTKNPKVIKQLKKIWDTSDNLWDYGVDEGYFKPEEAAHGKENHTMYMALSRVVDKSAGKKGLRKPLTPIGKAVMSRRGSDAPISNPLINTVMNQAKMYNEIEKNTTVRNIVNSVKEMPGYGDVFTEISPAMAYVGTEKLADFRKELENQLSEIFAETGQFVDVDQLDLSATESLYQLKTLSDPEMIISYYDKGVRKFIKFTDNDLGRELYKVMSSSNVTNLGVFGTVLRALSTPIVKLATIMNPFFAIKNVFADSANHFINSDRWVIPYLDIIPNVLRTLPLQAPYMTKALRKLGGITPWTNKIMEGYFDDLNKSFEEFLMSGAPLSTRASFVKKTALKKAQEITGLNRADILQHRTDGIKSFSDLMSAVKDALASAKDNTDAAAEWLSQLSELSQRFVEFEKTRDYWIKKGKTREEAIKLGGIAAKESTQNFMTKGELMRTLDLIKPYSGAKMGGNYKFGQTLRRHPFRTTTRIGILAAITITPLLLLINALGEKFKKLYQEQSAQTRTDYFLIPTGGDDFVKLKKPQGPVKPIINLIETMAYNATGVIPEEDFEKYMEDWTHSTKEELLPFNSTSDTSPGILRSVLEAQMNKNFYFNSDIVKKSMEDLDPENQYDETTLEIAKSLGNLLKISPKKIEHVLKNSMPGIGNIFLETTDEAIKNSQGRTQTAKRVAETVLGKQVLADPVSGSQSVDELFEKQKYFKNQEAEGRLTDEESLEYDKIKQGISTVTTINKQINEIDNDQTMSPEERAEKIRDLKLLRLDVGRYYNGKELVDETNKDEIVLMEYYPSFKNDKTTYKDRNKTYELDFSSTALKEEYANKFKTEYEEELKRLKRSREYSKASDAEKAQLEKELHQTVKTGITKEMKEIVYKRQYKNSKR